MVDAKGVKFAYTNEEGTYNFALNGVDICVQDGEFAVILGHNGSGKSTFARLVNALNTPLEGTLLVDGMDTREEEKLFDIRRTAGMVFQNPDNQLVATVVEEDVAFGPENLGIPQEEIVQRVEQSLEAVGMLPFRKRAPHMLSGGQKQRVAIAGTLAMNPRLIVFDEATAMLDPKGRSEIMEIMRTLNQERGITIIHITHFMEEAVDADRAVILSGGYVIADGDPKELLYRQDILEQAKLLPPFAAAMCAALRQGGADIPTGITSIETLAEEIHIDPEYAAPAPEDPLSPEAEAAPAVSVENLKYVYMQGTPFESVALEKVNLRFAQGEFVGIVGHTGSGKSTLAQIMAALIKGAEGSVRILGRDIFAKDMDRKWLRRNLGVVFQYPEYQLFEETVYKDIAYGPMMTGIPEGEIENRVKVAMELVGLDYELHKDASPFELSGGQKRKVAIAGVLAMEPKILILDEPIAGLDPMGRESLMELVSELNRCGTTIIMISHNMEGLAEYATRVVVMQKGHVAMNGTPREVFSQCEQVRAAGLDIPDAAKLALALRERGIQAPQELIRFGETRDWILGGIQGGAAND